MTQLRSGSSRQPRDPAPTSHAIHGRCPCWPGWRLSGRRRRRPDPRRPAAVDLVLNAAVAALVVYLGSARRAWTWLVLATTACVAADGGVGLVAGGCALGVAFAAVVLGRRAEVAGALVSALAVNALFRLPGTSPSALATVVAAAAVLPVVVSGYRACNIGIRRRLRIGLGIAVAASLALTTLATVVALTQRDALEAGIERARDGLRAAENGEVGTADRLLDEAERSFGDTSGVLGATWMAPTTWVPVLGQNVEALTVATQEGARLAGSSRAALLEADVDALQFDDGAIDLDHVRDVAPPLERLAATMAASVADLDAAASPWLVDAVGRRYEEFRAELDDAAADAAVAVEAVEAAPALFGGDGDRRYLILFTTPAEMRGLGGFIGSYAELTAVQGDLELTRSGRIGELRPGIGNPAYTISGPADYVARWGPYEVGRFVQDTTFSPDFPSVGEVWEEIYPQTRGGAPIDGVVVVDPYALAAFMQFTGPITIPEHDVTLTSENAADILLREQYAEFDEVRSTRVDFLAEATRLTFEALTTGDLPGPRQVTEILGPLVHQGRLLVYGTHPEEQRFFEEIDLDGALPPVDGDFLAVTTQNSGNNKIDTFLRRRIDYRVVFDPDRGRTEGRVTITLENDAPDAGLPYYVIGNRDPRRIPFGTNLMYLSVYSPWDVVGATLDDQPISVEQTEELGRRVYATSVMVPPGGVRQVTFELEGADDPSYDYRLTFAPQPLVNPDDLTVEVRGVEGWEVCRTRDLRLDEGIASARDRARGRPGGHRGVLPTVSRRPPWALLA